MKLYQNQTVKYVTADKKTVDAVIVDRPAGDYVHVAWGGGKHRALARFSAGGEPNTFSLPEDGPAGAVAAGAFTPGGGAPGSAKKSASTEPAAQP